MPWRFITNPGLRVLVSVLLPSLGFRRAFDLSFVVSAFFFVSRPAPSVHCNLHSSTSLGRPAMESLMPTRGLPSSQQHQPHGSKCLPGACGPTSVQVASRVGVQTLW
ncbi:hypothetical protein B0T19DRAFT_242165 [Cercophora scortea]|uniref:Uncharacterized protein n=1 Tax=Cercophora scortea TaxID=314031 RepID=A0AAE0IA75_9PEZI|nr:hypothetical protein B0T19DRAFT_242165 [Cercophora scortea]